MGNRAHLVTFIVGTTKQKVESERKKRNNAARKKKRGKDLLPAFFSAVVDCVWLFFYPRNKKIRLIFV